MSSSAAAMPEVVHKPELCSFVADCNGVQALLTYRLIGKGEVDFNHTYVPKAARGSGVAAKLVISAAEWAREQNLTIRASCWYARKVLRLD